MALELPEEIKRLEAALAAETAARIAAENALEKCDFFLNRSQKVGGLGCFVLNIPKDEPSAQTWNGTPEMDRIFGVDDTYPRTGESWLALIVQREEVSAYFSQQVFAVQKNFEKEYQIKRPSDGEVRWIFGRGELEFDDQDNCIRMFGTVQDITERKRMEQSVRKRGAHLRTLLQTIPDLVWLKDENGVFLGCNKMFERLLGAKEAAIIGKTDYDFVDKELADFFREHDRRAIAAGKPSSNEETVTFTDDGHRAHLHVIKTPMFDTEGNFIGVLGVGRDITERQQAAEEKARLQDRLQQAQKLESVGQLAGGVAHYFNNMMSIIIGYTELYLESMPPSNPIYHALKEIKRAAERSAAITSQLLTFARKQITAPREIDLNETVSGMIKMLMRSVGEKVALAWKPGAGVWPVKMDTSQIGQILTNLCMNARDAIGDRGKITIETKNTSLDKAYCTKHPEAVPGDFVLLAVTDDGHGMDKETLEKIFDPFFTTKAVGEGTGLGLATIYGIVKQNSGFISVHSEPNRGTIFKLYFPRHSVPTSRI